MAELKQGAKPPAVKMPTFLTCFIESHEGVSKKGQSTEIRRHSQAFSLPKRVATPGGWEFSGAMDGVARQALRGWYSDRDVCEQK